MNMLRIFLRTSTSSIRRLACGGSSWIICSRRMMTVFLASRGFGILGNSIIVGTAAAAAYFYQRTPLNSTYMADLNFKGLGAFGKTVAIINCKHHDQHRLYLVLDLRWRWRWWWRWQWQCQRVSCSPVSAAWCLSLLRQHQQ